MSKRIIYTSVFGGYDEVVEQSSNGWDWKCFSEDTHTPIYEDNNRNAKRFKVLPHRYLKDYDYSVWKAASWRIETNQSLCSQS